MLNWVSFSCYFISCSDSYLNKLSFHAFLSLLAEHYEQKQKATRPKKPKHYKAQVSEIGSGVAARMKTYLSIVSESLWLLQLSSMSLPPNWKQIRSPYCSVSKSRTDFYTVEKAKAPQVYTVLRLDANDVLFCTNEWLYNLITWTCLFFCSLWWLIIKSFLHLIWRSSEL